MKWSKYNILFKSRKNSCNLLYNLLSGLFMELDDTLYEKIKLIRYDINKIKLLTDSEITIFVDNKVLVTDDQDEFNKYKLAVLSNQYNVNNMHLTIAPTQDCNYRCKYCFEENRPTIYMDENTENSIVHFIKNKNIKNLNVCWYGGEPLLSKGTIYSLSSKFKSIIDNYEASIVTNGYLLDEDFIKYLDNLNIKYIQITIDGKKDTHNIRRPHVINTNNYDVIKENIKSLITFAPHIKLSIRVNVDKNNLDEFIDVYNEFKLLSKQIHIYPGFIHDTTSSCKNSSCLLNKCDKIAFYEYLYSKYGIYLDEMVPKLVLSSCMARSLNSFLIGPNGDMYKCWHHLGEKDKVVGNVNADKIFFDEALIANFMIRNSISDTSRCNKCKFFVICGGGCPDLKKIEDRSYTTCSIFKDNIKLFLEMKYDYLNK